MSHTKTQPSATDRRRFLRYTWRASRRACRWRCCTGPISSPRPSSAPIRSRSASRRAIRRRTASCCGPGSRRTRPIPSSLGKRRFPSAGASATDSPAAAGGRERRRDGAGRSWRTRCTSKCTACCRVATTSISSTWAARKARSAISAPRRPRDELLSELRFAFATCQDWPSGYYTAYRDMLQNDLDVVFHLGDYTYEYAIDSTNRGVSRARRVPQGLRGSAHVPAAAHAVQARPRPAGGAPEVSVRGDLGRSRGGQRLLRPRARVSAPVSGVHRQTRGGLSGLLRAHADPVVGGAESPRGSADLPAAAIRPAGRVHDAGRSAVPHPTTRAATANRSAATPR